MYAGVVIADYGSFALAMVLLTVSLYYLTLYKLQEEVRGGTTGGRLGGREKGRDEGREVRREGGRQGPTTPHLQPGPPPHNPAP